MDLICSFFLFPMNRNKISLILDDVLPKLEKKFGLSRHYKIKLNYYVIKNYYNGEDHCNFQDSVKGIFDKEKVDGLINPWIEIYADNITCKKDLIKTILHEYCHYLQSPCWMVRYYNMGYNYITHPYEIQANQFEEKWYKEFL